MRRQKDRAERLQDIGSTSALAGMVEIVTNGSAAGILARQLIAILDRRQSPEDRDYLITGFCDELESFVESVPGAQRADASHKIAARRGRTA